MEQEMLIRNYSPRTIKLYLGAIARLAKYYNCSPDKLDHYQVKSYLHHCIKDKGISASTINQIVSAFRILYSDVLGRKWEPTKFKRARREKKLPTVFSKEEISRFLDSITNKKHQAIFILAYSSGIRLDEIRLIKFCDIDADRMQIRINKGKGKKTRFTLLSPKLLCILREYYKIYRPITYLFEGQTPGKPITTSTIQKVFNKNILKAGITKPVSFHSLRHTFATHMLEQGTNLRLIQQLMGHKSLSTTMVYLHVSCFETASIENPYDNL